LIEMGHGESGNRGNNCLGEGTGGDGSCLPSKTKNKNRKHAHGERKSEARKPNWGKTFALKNRGKVHLGRGKIPQRCSGGGTCGKGDLDMKGRKEETPKKGNFQSPVTKQHNLDQSAYNYIRQETPTSLGKARKAYGGNEGESRRNGSNIARVGNVPRRKRKKKPGPKEKLRLLFEGGERTPGTVKGSLFHAKQINSRHRSQTGFFG